MLVKKYGSDDRQALSELTITCDKEKAKVNSFIILHMLFFFFPNILMISMIIQGEKDSFDNGPCGWLFSGKFKSWLIEGCGLVVQAFSLFFHFPFFL